MPSFNISLSIKKILVMDILKSYFNHLMTKGDTIPVARKQVYTLISSMMDRGDATKETYKTFDAFVESRSASTEGAVIPVNPLLAKVTESAIASEGLVPSQDEAAVVSQYLQAKTAYDAAQKAVIESFSAETKVHMTNLVASYADHMDPAFVTTLKAVIG
jgi:hypothetical protein